MNFCLQPVVARHLSQRMQSTRAPTAVETILTSKLADVKKKNSELIEAVQNISSQVKTTQEQVDSFVTAQTYTAKDALILGMDVDDLLETVTTCLHAISDGLNKTQKLNQPARLHVPLCDSNNTTAMKSDALMDNNAAAVDTLKVQMEVLQQQVSSLQDRQDTNRQDQETMLRGMQKSADTDFNLRLQNVEAKLLLVQDVQTREGKTLENVVQELSTMRIDVMALQDDVTNIKTSQTVLERDTEEDRNKTDDNVRLRYSAMFAGMLSND